MSLPVGKARKLTPKYIRPYRITREVSRGSSYEVDLDAEMKKRGVHPVFHASLLRPHIPNDDRKFPGRLYKQIVSIHGDSEEWAVERITVHTGKGARTKFLIVWKSGDRTWEPLASIRDLEALVQYYKALGIRAAHELPKKGGPFPLEEAPSKEANGSSAEKEPVSLPAKAVSTHPPCSSLAGLVSLSRPLPITVSTAYIMTTDAYTVLFNRWLDGGVYPGNPPESWAQANPHKASILFSSESGDTESTGLLIRGKALSGGRGRYRSCPYNTQPCTYARTEHSEPELTAGTLGRLWECSQRQVDSITIERDKARACAKAASRFSGRGRGRSSDFRHPSGLNHNAQRALGKRGFHLGQPNCEGHALARRESRYSLSNYAYTQPRERGLRAQAYLGPGQPPYGARDGSSNQAPPGGSEHQPLPRPGCRAEPGSEGGVNPSSGKETHADGTPTAHGTTSNPTTSSPNDAGTTDPQDSLRESDPSRERIEGWRQDAMEVDGGTTLRGARVGTPSEFAISELLPLPDDEQEGLTRSFGVLRTSVPPSA